MEQMKVSFQQITIPLRCCCCLPLPCSSFVRIVSARGSDLLKVPNFVLALFLSFPQNAEMMEMMPRKPANNRNPLLAEETARSQKRSVIVRSAPPKRTLIGGHFVLMEDMCTARRDDVKRRTLLREERERIEKERLDRYMETYRNGGTASGRISSRGDSRHNNNNNNYNSNQNDSARMSTARSRLEAAQRAARKAQEEEESETAAAGQAHHKSAPISGRSFGRTPRPESASYSYRSAVSRPEEDDDGIYDDDDGDNDEGGNSKVEEYFAAARATGRNSARSSRPYSAAPQSTSRTERSEYEGSRELKSGRASARRPQSARAGGYKMAKTRSSTLKKLALTKPKFAAAARAARAEQFLDERASKKAAQKLRPKSAAMNGRGGKVRNATSNYIKPIQTRAQMQS